MALAFLLDEQLRGALWHAIQRRNARSGVFIDAVCVGDPEDLPIGSSDSDILTWVEREGRLLVSRDRTTMISFFRRHLQAGNHCPGLLLLRRGISIPDVITALELIADAGEPGDFADRCENVP